MDTRVFFDIYTGVRPQVFFDMYTGVQPPHPPCIHHPPNAHHSSLTSSGIALDRESDHVFPTNCGDIVDNLSSFLPSNHPIPATKSSNLNLGHQTAHPRYQAAQSSRPNFRRRGNDIKFFQSLAVRLTPYTTL